MTPKVQRAEHNYALVDEADNIFIDEARTPLIIASPTRPATEAETLVFRGANKLAQEMKPDEHFRFDIKKQKLELTDVGRQMVRWSNPPTGTTTSAMDKLEEALEQALHAHYRFRRDQQYMVDNGKIILEGTTSNGALPARAAKLAREIEGVNDVESRIVSVPNRGRF